MTTAEAFQFCRAVARREAKNFYWAFRVLPRFKSDAMCAVYAFMRHADDLADDEAVPLRERMQRMRAWTEEWRSARRGGVTSNPVFVALNEVQRRFAVPDDLLEDLLRGVTLDLERSEETAPGTLQTYATFDELYGYCYLVASVVGLVSIRIFGYSNAAVAERLAEETGVAFQLTNILRDVKEDFELGRLYLPMDLLAEDQVPVDRIRALVAGAPMAANERAMLATVAIRAEKLYLSGRRLVPMIDRDSRAALWVLLRIYHGLLARIAVRKMDVFSRRVAVPGGVKVGILGRGMAMALWNRVWA